MNQNKKNGPVSVEIRKAGPDELEAAASVEAACFSMPWSRQAMEESVRTGQMFFLTAYCDGKAVGECALRTICGEGEITNVAVLPEYRRLGIGRALMAELIKQGKKAGIREFTLEVRAGNRAAIRLYEENGFKTEGIRRNFYENPREDAMIMWKRQEE